MEHATDNFELTLTVRALRQLKAEAWDEGFEAGAEFTSEWERGSCPTNPEPNPYRD